jgi:AcrR family transcriptional regulator
MTKDPTKRETILDCSTRVFAAAGFANADVQEIADLAGVGKGTVYRYFGNKEQLFLAAADACMSRLQHYVLDAIAQIDDAVEFVRRGGERYAEFFQEHPELVEILIQERAAFRGSIPDTHMVYRAKNRGLLEERLRRAIRDGVFREVDVHEATSALANVLYGTVVCGCLEGHSKELKEMAHHAVEILLRGLLVDPSVLDRE